MRRNSGRVNPRAIRFLTVLHSCTKGALLCAEANRFALVLGPRSDDWSNCAKRTFYILTKCDLPICSAQKYMLIHNARMCFPHSLSLSSLIC